ncbi:DNA-protecting protein DprA [Sphingomonas sp. CGMCC 1.13654]|uniref:DNA-protecting protein DprA n=1 Tax=Sphingomonas chungangi TaxID=2683589 RepID=A0A838LC82_9SPHN|nr:DNA-processing protein DprA [Sphingomonas chungangi]MBA2935088.1 DNA-protecting protein DprA [Sphingomonas chungangi]MVW54204.1 DNA-protecting protein DprA [Sphingomonas chungangi]
MHGGIDEAGGAGGGSRVDREDRIARLRLMRTPTVGPVTYAQLLARFGTAAAALEAIPDLARRGGGKPPSVPPRGAIEREVEAVEKAGARYLFLGLPGYPAMLATIPTAPPALIVRGKRALLDRPVLGMVGARNASASACRFARGIAAELGERGITVASGLARGIDTAAHQGSIEAGTVAVIAGGIDVAYPPENADLQERIANEGLLIAEQPPGIEPRARHFPYRNRIIAGLAQAVLVVEAAPKSGSLITARYAGEYGREVLAVPGSPLDPRAQGCNLLIREGATLIQTAEDVLEMLRPIDPRMVSEPTHSYEAPVQGDAEEGDRRAVIELLGPVPTPVDEIVRQSGCPPAIVQTVLLELELAGRLERHAGGQVSLA